jgi:hypothetical protein
MTTSRQHQQEKTTIQVRILNSNSKESSSFLPELPSKEQSSGKYYHAKTGATASFAGEQNQVFLEPCGSSSTLAQSEKHFTLVLKRQADYKQVVQELKQKYLSVDPKFNIREGHMSQVILHCTYSDNVCFQWFL